jgi:hypothetical protein
VVRAPPKPLEGEIIEPDRYEDISALGLMQKTYKDTHLPYAIRLDAAQKAAPYEVPRLAQSTQDVTAGLTIRIEGGLPDLPGTNIIMPHEAGDSKKPNGSG